MNDTSANSNEVDATATRAFGIEKYLFKKIPWALGFMALAILVLFLARGGDSSDDSEARVVALFIIFASLAYIGFAFHRRYSPRKPMLELSPSGILFRIAKNKELRIPWSEIHGLELIDIRGAKGHIFRDVTAALVSREFFDANNPVKSWWGRGPGWNVHFVPRDEMVQVAFHHDLLTVPADELWQEIETRWRVFSGSPSAPLLATPRVVRERGWIFGWKPTRWQQRAGAAMLAVAAVAMIYFWQYLHAWITFPDFNGDTGTYYLSQAFDQTGVYARLPGKGLVVLRRSDFSGIGVTRCRSDVERDAARSGLTPAYTAFAICSTDMPHVSGVAVRAIFKLAGRTFTSKDWQDKPVEYRAISPVEMSVEEANARLCELGVCADA